MARKEQWQTRLPNDISETLHDYRDERGLSKAETMRRAAEQLAENYTAETPSTSEQKIVADGGMVMRPMLWGILISGFLVVWGSSTYYYIGSIPLVLSLAGVGSGLTIFIITFLVLLTDTPEQVDAELRDKTLPLLDRLSV